MSHSDDAEAVSTSCGIAVSAQMQRLRVALAAAGHGEHPVVSAEFADLEEDELQSAIDAVVAGEPSPLVLVDGRIVCSGSVEIPLILKSLGTGGL